MNNKTHPETRPETPLGWVFSFILAIVAVVVAMVLRLALTTWIGPGLPTYITFYPAVMVVALLYGFWSGLVATAFASVLVDYWLLPPTGQFFIASPVDRVGIVLFSSFGLFISLVAEFTRRYRSKAAAYDREVALRGSEERLALAVSATQIGMFDWNLTRNSILWSQTQEAIFGYAPTTTTEHDVSRWTDRIHPEDLQLFEEKSRRCMQDHSPLEVQYRIIWPDGSLHWVETKGVFFLHSDGKANRMLGVVMDISERKVGEEALRESKQQNDFLANILQSSSQPFGQGFPDGRLGLFNKSFEQLTGYSEHELKSMDWARVLTPPEWQEFERHKLEELQRTGKPVRYEKEYIRKDGSRVPIELLVHLVTDQDGKPLYYYSFLADITERKLAEQALLESENKLRLFIEHAPAAIAMFDSDMKYLATSSRWFREYGIKEQNIIGRSHYDIFPDIPDRWKAIHRRVLAGSVERNEADPWVRADGHTDWIRWELRPWYTHGDEIGGLIIFSENINDLKRIEMALKENEERLKRSQEIAHLGSWELDLVNNVLNWSDEVYRIFGLEPQEFGATYEAFLERVHPDDREAVDEAYSGSLRDSVDTYDIEHRVIRKSNGEVRIVHEKCEHFRDESGAIIRSVGMVHDITERKQAEEVLRKSEEQFHTLADSIPNLAWWANGDGYITWYNRRWYEYTGTTPDQMEGWGWQSVHDPEVLPKVLERWKASIATGEPFDMEFPLRGADGVFRLFLTRVMPLKDSAGVVLRWFGTNTDISALKQMEESLRRAVEELQTIMAVAPVAIWVSHDPQCHEIIGNLTADLFYEAREGENVSAGPADGHPIPPRRFFRNGKELTASELPMQEAAANDVKVTADELEVQLRSGRRITMYGSANPLRDVNGRVRGCVGAFLDITALKLAEEELRKNRNLLNEMGKIAKVGGWEFNTETLELQWTEEVYHIHEVELSYKPTVSEAIDFYAPDSKPVIARAVQRAIEIGEPFDLSLEIITAKGKHRLVQAIGKGDRERKIVSGTFQDITERKLAEEALRELNDQLEQRIVERTRFYTLIARVNDAIVRYRDRQELLDNVCRILVDTGGFRLAWIGTLDEASREIRPEASWGETSYLNGIRLTANDEPEGMGPSGRAIVEGRHIVSADFEEESRMLPWRQRARAHGIRSSSVFPLFSNGRAIGEITIYSEKPSFFTEEEISLLLSVANNISYALDAIAGEKKRVEAEEASQANKRRTRTAGSNTNI